MVMQYSQEGGVGRWEGWRQIITSLSVTVLVVNVSERAVFSYDIKNLSLQQQQHF
jgi:hypothetical protein